MIEVLILLGASGRYSGFTVKGHSEYAPKGQDIVCSAVSFLAYTIAASLEKMASETRGIKVSSRQAEGTLSVDIEYNTVPEERTLWTVELLINTMKLGLDELIRQYPAHLALRKVKGPD